MSDVLDTLVTTVVVALPVLVGLSVLYSTWLSDPTEGFEIRLVNTGEVVNNVATTPVTIRPRGAATLYEVTPCVWGPVLRFTSDSDAFGGCLPVMTSADPAMTFRIELDHSPSNPPSEDVWVGVCWTRGKGKRAFVRERAIRIRVSPYKRQGTLQRWRTFPHWLPWRLYRLVGFKRSGWWQNMPKHQRPGVDRTDAKPARPRDESDGRRVTHYGGTPVPMSALIPNPTVTDETRPEHNHIGDVDPDRKAETT